MQVQLNDAGTAYVDGEGTTYDRVSNVLRCLGMAHVYPAGNDMAKNRGTAVHLACRLINEDRLDEASVAPDIAAPVNGYKNFLRVSNFTPMYWELSLGSVYGFAGSIDVLGWLNDRFVLIDYKTGTVDRSVEIQTGAYELLWNENNPDQLVEARFALNLTQTAKGYNLLPEIEVPASIALASYAAFLWKEKRPLSQIQNCLSSKALSFSSK